MGKETEYKIYDIQPELETKATKRSIKGWIKALKALPYGKQYPLPTSATVINENLVTVNGERAIVVNVSDTKMVPGKKVIIYKQGM
ncbi:hypothetical protein A3A76_01460 [Candidatus Woesebacteria bacterium RIFCSPLOWO2_01_FULL_39_23]|uniref:Uncharacterized protein n=1 Tax=Candidatus Woesebacteria bacterium RIFCSPHIGHO2_01_FULL_40_22 TaxID=1802499 RepID=A0A1F7YGV6_9BACT|nr:MAG: hypothetical protein A2141_04910 [Candidatus Woesebacteria bacterium RBG_16_40_11]OGM26492.1 MAG: hypothetical protein A2628_03055 [Candidatus Woesebacteria bacterium RIFCSPHIGHO2_01_FULL_40_22]OGM37661.1 MAG: hypothetical protein A3E41_05575 [Candidatus Woesebacteria bacterium RIFCSPHIGHO2_12_FULL_38_9]OGM62945.1 MAG: hypothetical protein A3A76_01460 [Candidatus Woesebacteria bacterium RIFCSPLOWO2_01_FULL_39_23]